jgi:hypothetical protein
MLSLTYDQYDIPNLITRSADGKKFWRLSIKSKDQSNLGDSRLLLDVDFNFTFVWQTLDANGDVEARERVTFLYTSDGKVKPSPRTLRVLGDNKVSTILKALYRGGDPEKGPVTA